MKLSQELTYRGFVNQTTFTDITALDGEPLTFYWGVDPSASSMTIGNLAMAMMVRHFIAAGHKAILLVGGATGLIGDPDGKSTERDLKSLDEIAANKAAIVDQYRRIFEGLDFDLVDNYDWFKDMGYLTFLREIGKHVPMRQMLGREFVQSRLGEEGAGISYAEFSYSLIQGYDFLHLHREKGVSLQVAGADQWGNSIAGVELIRRVTGNEAHVWTGPIVVNKTTGVKFGKSEAGAIWLDPAQTDVRDFYQFWINVDDLGVEDYLKIYTLLSPQGIEAVMADFNTNRAGRIAQKTLAYEVTKLVHGEDAAKAVQIKVANGQWSDKTVMAQATVVDTLLEGGLVSSKTEGRALLRDGGVYINNGWQIDRDHFEDDDFINGKLILRKGKKLQNSIIVTK